MRFEKSYIPYGGYWSSPYSRWQGSLSHLHPLKLAAQVAVKAMAERDISPEVLDGLIVGMTIPSQSSFYGSPWLAGMIGAKGITGPTISQACATAGRCLAAAAFEIESGTHETELIVTCDKTSNGPHVYYPNPTGIGGMGDKEDWVWDNFGFDPFAKNSMIQTAENVAKEAGITREEQDEVALLRHAQYQDALKDDRAFLRKFMTIPFEVMDGRGRKVIKTLDSDEGIVSTTKEKMAALRPALPEGTVTPGTQTFPADGNTALVVTTRKRARELGSKDGIEVKLISFGQVRAKIGFMAQATVPAAVQALDRAGIGIADVKAIKTHNPFAVNDVYFAKQMGVKVEDMNNYGSSLIYGHPQAPTGARLIIELIEELAMKGGGYGLFDGCAAGDTAFSVVLRVDAK
jgi:acetyl-CoA acetyltransferase family protein